MAQHPLSFFIFVTSCSLFVNLSLCFNPKLLNASILDGFSNGVATWYGPPQGAGTDGGACGYGGVVSQPPYSAFVSAGNPNLFKGGQECGACYQVRCNSNPLCSGTPVTVTITDECPGCTDKPFHFDLSGTAFGALAKPGQAQALRDAGTLPINFNRVPCNYKAWKIAFRVDPGANHFYMSFVTEFEDGDGDLGLVELQPAGSPRFIPMQLSQGATWKVNLPGGSNGPYSVRITTVESRKTVVAPNVIPANWAPGQTYWSSVNIN